VDINWPESNDWVALAASDLHVWAIPLDVTGVRLTELEARLTCEERQRAERFLREEVGRRFIVSRASLRSLLGRYLAMPPSDVPMVSGLHGKPQLAARAEASDLQFNLAHSGELALVAVTRGCDVGVDLEQLRPIEHWHEIAARYFHVAEAAAIAAVDPSEQTAAFLRCWTRKEAILKACGVGLGHSLRSFEVPVTEHAAQWVELFVPSFSAARRYWLQSAGPCAGYLAAVATGLQRTAAIGFVHDV
jgi:4'-phosphopantetheinyl transferase